MADGQDDDRHPCQRIRRSGAIPNRAGAPERLIQRGFPVVTATGTHVANVADDRRYAPQSGGPDTNRTGKETSRMRALWMHPVGRHLAIAIAVKLALLFALWFVWFRPAPPPDAAAVSAAVLRAPQPASHTKE